jgi:hypothetical protein
MVLPELDYGLSNDRLIEDNSHIFGTLYYRNIFKCIQLLLAQLPLQVSLDLGLVCLADTKGRRIYSEMNTGD